MKSECCGAEVKTLDSGEFTDDVARAWEELECQECGNVYFRDEPKKN
jgi:hypothetical protein